MKSNEIEKIILDFANNKDNLERAILISGDWGVGKTYFTQQAIDKFNKLHKDEKDKSKNKIYYVSLFGADSIEDIQTNIYDTLKPANSVTKKALSVTSAFTNGIEKLNIIANIADGISLLLRQDSDKTLKKRIKKNVTFIFDDIERTKENFSYISFHGLLNTLQLYGVKVVCLCSSEHISEDNGLKKEFQEFKEKTFDCVYDIDQAPTGVIFEMFDKKNLGLTEYDIDCLNYFFKNNIRNAKKTEILMSKVLTTLNQKKLDYTKKVDSFFLLSSCLFAILIILQDQNFVKHETQNEKDISYDIFYVDNESSKGLKEQTYEDFHAFFQNNKDHFMTPIPTTSTLVSALIKYYLYNNDTELINYFTINSKVDKKNIRDLEFMSEKDNINFSKRFIDDIKNGIFKFDNSSDFDQLETFLDRTIYPIDENISNDIAKCIALEIHDTNILQEHGADREDIKVERKRDNTFINILNKAQNFFIGVSSSQEIKKINNLSSKKDYYTLDVELSRYFGNPHIPAKSRTEVMNKAKELNYFLPKNLSGELNKTQWGLCCTIAYYIRGFKELTPDYVSTLTSYKEKGNSKTIAKRVDLLLTNFK